ncbi:MAG: hypothetical protein K2O02_06705 [Lachnospiraceae bacterium]|nr:hypothetical protein [Lachnospiraceae bacterium]
MLGKLIKHEFKATGKSFTLLFGATLALTIFSKIGMHLPFDNFIWRIIVGVAAAACVFCIFAGFIVAFVIMIYRFYNNMLRDEGYLSHTLPVKTWQHLISKLVTDLVWLLASIAVSLLSLFIIYVMEHGSSMLEGFNTFLEVVNEYPRLIAYIAGFCVLLILLFFIGMLEIFAALALGHMFSKHRVFASVVFYFVLNYLLVTIGAIITNGLMLVFPKLSHNLRHMHVQISDVGTFEEYMEVLDGTMLQMFAVCAVIQIIIIAICFIMTNYVMSKKLNLE